MMRYIIINWNFGLELNKFSLFLFYNENNNLDNASADADVRVKQNCIPKRKIFKLLTNNNVLYWIVFAQEHQSSE